MSQCIDPIGGKILAGWRYDISGLAPEMRGDYEEHFAACGRKLPAHEARRQNFWTLTESKQVFLASHSTSELARIKDGGGDCGAGSHDSGSSGENRRSQRGFTPATGQLSSPKIQSSGSHAGQF